MVGKKIRLRNPSLVVDEISEILSYGIDRINVADDLFVSSRGKVKEVCDEILPPRPPVWVERLRPREYRRPGNPEADARVGLRQRELRR